MSLWDKLPTDIIQHIFEYDPTYKEILNESLNFINHACPTCCCDGGEKNRYRHHYDIGTFEFTFWDWEWRRRNACPKHTPEDFDKDGNQTEYNWRDMDYYIPNYDIIDGDGNLPVMTILPHFQPITLHYEIRTGRNWYRYNGTINYNKIMLDLWVFSTRNKNTDKIPIKTYSRKKLSGARFMDMTHDQRPIAA